MLVILNYMILYKRHKIDCSKQQQTMQQHALAVFLQNPVCTMKLINQFANDH